MKLNNTWSAQYACDLRWNVSGDELQSLVALIKVSGEVWVQEEMGYSQSSNTHGHPRKSEK